MVGSGSASPELVARTQRNLVAFHWRCLQEGPNPRRNDWLGATALGSDLPTAFTNTLFVDAPITDPARLLRAARDFYRRSPAWRLSAATPLRETWTAAASAAGMRVGEVVPRMILSPVPPPPKAPAGLTIRAASNVRERRDFCAAAGRGFRIPVWFLRLAFLHRRVAPDSADPALRLFVGYVDGAPVASSAAVTTDGVTGVFFVATVPESRRRGFGEALTWAAIDDGRQMGADAAWLQSTAMGRPMYERMGFRWVHDDYDWVSPAAGFAQVRTIFRLLGLALAPSGARSEDRS
jgi:GNAT superfamily N-acetyltransferase